MADEIINVYQQQKKPIKLKKWKIKEGKPVSVGHVIFIYEEIESNKHEQMKWKSQQAGIVYKLSVQEDDIVSPGQILCEIKPCTHPTIMMDMCAECGTDLRKDNGPKSTASVPMVHAIPDLKVSHEQAQKLGKADTQRLIETRKLVLLVDLDQTLIHTTNDSIPPNIKDVYHFQLYGTNSIWYHTRLRPSTMKFLNSVCNLYELHICTFGTRNYAHTIAMILDPDQKFFGNRILSRDECFDPTSKKANLSALFPCGDQMVCIIDDREDVWSNALNLIRVKPYHFFQHTGDINAPPGLDKHENDDKVGVDLTKVVTKPKDTENQSEKEKKTEEENDNKSEADKQEKSTKEKSEKAKLDENNTVDKDKKSEEEESKEIKISENKSEDDKQEKSMTEESEEIKLNEDKSEVDKEKKSIEEKSKEEEVDENNSKENDDEVINNSKRELASLLEEDPIKTTLNAEPQTESEAKIDNEIKTDNEEITLNKKTSADEKKVNESTTKIEGIKSGSETETGNKKTSEDENSEKKTDKPTKNGTVIEDANNSSEDKDILDIEDPDDYLIYLEDILKRIHKEFYKKFDEMDGKEIPDLKEIIPSVRKTVLKGYKLVFSGLVPTHYTLEDSRAYQVARSLGAEVFPDLDDRASHLVAVRPGTVKVNTGRRMKKLKIVTPDWLWCCAERWDHVHEGIFPLNARGSKNRNPPPHCSSPEHAVYYSGDNYTPALRKRSPSNRFMDNINPLMSFSSDDIADMDKEVADILDNESDESEDEIFQPYDGQMKFEDMIQKEVLDKFNKDVEEPDLYDKSDEEENMSKRKKLKRKYEETDRKMEELPSTKFRRGEVVENELDVDPLQDPDDNDSDSLSELGDSDDREWNMMGEALEREFLSE